MSLTVKIEFGEEPRALSLKGRMAWALLKLVAAGKKGCSTFHDPAPRWGHYVFALRGHGLPIETLYEPHGGRFPGTHARYVLTIPVNVIDPSEAA